MEEAKERVIQKADELFRMYGLRSVTMDDLARSLAMSKRTLYQLFKDKRALVKEAISCKMEEDHCVVEEARKKAQNAIEEIVLIFQHFRTVIATLKPTFLYELERYFPEAWQSFHQYKNEVIREQVERNLKRGMAEGIYRSDLRPDILAAMRVEQVFIVFNPQVFPPEKFHFVEVQEELLKHFIYGVLSEKGLQLVKQYEEEGKLWLNK
ncbi:MAG: TetR family transcriptional regulator [Thermonema sp.]|uniref:TetR/AcrR family transcriptional regulator n=1 Tax=Thermonema sp. TaxID=2231181 RepID=UPI0021DEE882|nr:TetR/AcrR family transcriptional regulator [Thermonema sp.]GIV39973.1 MAG: TetR family transcriptional regulator [Thermonema sp.]